MKTFANARYERLMLAMAEEPDDTFLKGKIVTDFGCGPIGSLTWVKSTKWYQHECQSNQEI